jgi:hypothetical protein
VARGDVEAEVVEVEVVEVASSSRWHPRRCRRGVVVVIVSSSSLTWRSRPRRGVLVIVASSKLGGLASSLAPSSSPSLAFVRLSWGL